MVLNLLLTLASRASIFRYKAIRRASSSCASCNLFARVLSSRVASWTKLSDFFSFLLNPYCLLFGILLDKLDQEASNLNNHCLRNFAVLVLASKACLASALACRKRVTPSSVSFIFASRSAESFDMRFTSFNIGLGLAHEVVSTFVTLIPYPPSGTRIQGFLEIEWQVLKNSNMLIR